MRTFTVLYSQPDHNPIHPPLAFICQAEDTDHAEEQCENAYPDCVVVWVVHTDNAEAALKDYYDDPT